MTSRYDDLLARTRASIEELAPDVAARRQQNGAVLIDVRESDEVENGIANGAIHIPRGLLEARINAVAPDVAQAVVLYCASGARSAFAARSLSEMGYEHVASVAGGFNAWKNADLPYSVSSGLSAEQRQRYSRHLLLPEIGTAGQEALLAARVLLIGAGGLGSPAALYLAAAGVGTIGIVDDDVVELSNLQRQILHTSARTGVAKTESARQMLGALNPDITVVGHQLRLGPGNVRELVSGYDLVIDGSDNFATRYLVNDTCVALGKPWVFGSIYRFEGQVSTFIPGQTGCYRCLFPEPPPAGLAPNCAETGVLGVLPGVVGAIQATEALKLILDLGTPLAGRLLTYDAREMEFLEMRFGQAPDCPVCIPGRGVTPESLLVTESCGVLAPTR